MEERAQDVCVYRCNVADIVRDWCVHIKFDAETEHSHLTAEQRQAHVVHGV